MPSILDQLQVKKLENRVRPEAHVLWLSRYCPFNDHYLTPKHDFVSNYSNEPTVTDTNQSKNYVPLQALS